MAVYGVKLVDRRKSSQHELGTILSSVKRMFDLVFDGTADSVNVSWGVGLISDNYVVHFVEDIGASYLRSATEWQGVTVNIAPDASGHTHFHNGKSGSEVYRRSSGTLLRLSKYGKIVCHEAFHNLFPYIDSDSKKTGIKDAVHETMGMGLAAENPTGDEPNAENKAWLQRGFSVRNSQLL